MANKHKQKGEPVSVIFTGTYLGYDSDLGYHYIRGSFVNPDGSGHVDWTIPVHWSADLDALSHYGDRESNG